MAQKVVRKTRKKERKNILGGLFEFYKTKSMNWALHAVAKS